MSSPIYKANNSTKWLKNWVWAPFCKVKKSSQGRKNRIFRVSTSLGGSWDFDMVRLLFQLFVADPLNLILAPQITPRCVNPPHGCLSHSGLCYIGVYHGVLGHFWGKNITFPKSTGIHSEVAVEAGNCPEKPQKVILRH